MRDPTVLLFDEPLSNLDARLRVAMRAEIKSLRQRLKTTTVYVTHDQIEAMTMADRIVAMRDGRIEQVGTPLQLFDRPLNQFVAQFIGSPSMNLIEGRLVRTGAADFVDALGHRWPVVGVTGNQEGQRVVYGARPTDLQIGEPGVGIRGRVVVVEPTGAETEVVVDISGPSFVVVHPGRTSVRPDEEIGVTVDASSGHVFDLASGDRMN